MAISNYVLIKFPAGYSSEDLQFEFKATSSRLGDVLISHNINDFSYANVIMPTGRNTAIEEEDPDRETICRVPCIELSML